ncbi:HAD-IIB family hydrolase [Ferrimonas gelatinilytica]|uniref:Mannosyl-3-phosphoglycerate phosphatase-related protein n=1 Tax=Ferrimonas gelatinilytica TaxID=1255257 RepID=A0ABP9S5D7_9GAMM
MTARKNTLSETPPRLIFTDLDGTLLDHHSYDFGPALPALERCRSLGIPVIFNTSKTLEESQALARELGIEAPLVVENGSAIWLPASAQHATEAARGKIVVLGARRSDLVGFLHALREQEGYSLQSFSDWDSATLAAHTGLSLTQASSAQQRAYSEPLLWQDTEHAFLHFQSRVQRAGYRLLRGGRFLHLLGQTDKGRALRWLCDHYHGLWGQAPRVMALGDGQNDSAMLEAAQIAVQVRSPVHPFPTLSRASTNARVIQTQLCGPEGWNEAVQAWLDETQ